MMLELMLMIVSNPGGWRVIYLLFSPKIHRVGVPHSIDTVWPDKSVWAFLDRGISRMSKTSSMVTLSLVSTWLSPVGLGSARKRATRQLYRVRGIRLLVLSSMHCALPRPAALCGSSCCCVGLNAHLNGLAAEPHPESGSDM